MVSPSPTSVSAIPFPLTGPVLATDDQMLLAFLRKQLQDFGGNLALEPDFWVLFAIPVRDERLNTLARDLLKSVKFAYFSGEAEGDAWILYYVSTAVRTAAVFWLEDLIDVLAGQVRGATPGQQAMIKNLLDSDSPHRVARGLAELRTRGTLSIGAIRDPQLVRSLLDRLHAQEPLYFSAFQTLLENDLIDLLVLARKLMEEDIRLGNTLMQGAISQDPFAQSRQVAAAHIRKYYLRFKIISPMDQQKNAAIGNPYVAFTEMKLEGEDTIIRVDGIDRPSSRKDFVTTIRMLRRSLYRGARIEELNTHSPWVTEETAQPLRFIKQQMESRKEVPAIDWLYMLERAVDPDWQCG
jgi:hypothetical protein